MKKPKIDIRYRADDPKKDGRTFREAELQVETRDAGDGKTETIVRATVSSETPYPRFMYDDEVKAWVRGHEVLGHTKGEIDDSRMKDGLVIQDTHWGDQIGIIRKPELKDGKLGGVIEFGCGARAQEIAKDAAKGIRRNMSVGYVVKQYKKDGKAEDGLPIFRVTKWMPYEASFVNVPADTNIGVGRVAEPNVETTGAAVETPAAATETGKEKAMKPEQIAALVAKAERAHMKATEVTDMVVAGKSYEEICDAIAERACAYADELAKKPAAPAEPKTKTAIDDGNAPAIVKSERKYNLVNVIRNMVAAHEGKIGPDVGFEREVSDEIAKRSGKNSEKGFYIPSSALLGSRAFDKANAAAALVATDTLFGEFIEALVADTVLGAAGGRTLAGLVGDVTIPKSGSATAYWVATEGGNATETTPNIGQVGATPHTVGAYTDITRKLLMQSGIGAQTLIADLLREAIGRAIEAAVFSGSGASGQPLGLDNWTETIGGNSVAIPTVSMTAGSPTHDNLVDFWQKVYTANAARGSLKYIGSPAVKALLCKTRDYTPFNNTGAKASSGVVGAVGSEYLCTKDGKVEGYDFLMSNLCNAKKLYFGDWSQIMLAFWSGIDLTVDTSSLSKSGGVRVVALQDCDVIVRHREAFAIGTAIA